MAAHNAGGLVIVQVERIVERGSIPPRLVHLPAALVDKARTRHSWRKPSIPPWECCPLVAAFLR